MGQSLLVSNSTSCGGLWSISASGRGDWRRASVSVALAQQLSEALVLLFELLDLPLRFLRIY
jgi:hypothetical protein